VLPLTRCQLPKAVDSAEPAAIWHGSRGAMSQLHDGKSLSKEEEPSIVLALQVSPDPDWP
jgi:hypothetical protein